MPADEMPTLAVANEVELFRGVDQATETDQRHHREDYELEIAKDREIHGSAKGMNLRRVDQLRFLGAFDPVGLDDQKLDFAIAVAILRCVQQKLQENLVRERAAQVFDIDLANQLNQRLHGVEEKLVDPLIGVPQPTQRGFGEEIVDFDIATLPLLSIQHIEQAVIAHAGIRSEERPVGDQGEVVEVLESEAAPDRELAHHTQDTPHAEDRDKDDLNGRHCRSRAPSSNCLGFSFKLIDTATMDATAAAADTTAAAAETFCAVLALLLP